MKHPLFLFLLFFFLHIHCFGQSSDIQFNTKQSLGYLTTLKIKRHSEIDYKKLFVDEQEVSKLYFSYDGSLNAYFGKEVLKSIPEEYDSRVSTIKDDKGIVVGMTKKYKNIHFLNLNNQIFKLERLSSETQFKLCEIRENENECVSFPKRIIVEKNGIIMEIYHNLDYIPVVALPFIINTREVDNVVSNKLIENAFIASFVLGMKFF